MGGGRKKNKKGGNQGAAQQVVGGISITIKETSKKGKAAEASTSKPEPTTRPSKNVTNVEVPAATNPAGASCNSKRQNNTVGQRKNKANKVPTVGEKASAPEQVGNLDESETSSEQVESWDKDVSQLDTHGGNKADERPQNFNNTPLNRNSEASIGTKTWFDNNTVQPTNQPVLTNYDNWDDSEPENTDNSNMEMYPSEGESLNQVTVGIGYLNIKSSDEHKHEKTLEEQASVNPYHASDSSSATAKFSSHKNTSMENTGRDQSETSRSGGNNSLDSSDFSSQSRRSDDSDLLMPYNKKINNRYSDDYSKSSNRTSQRFSSKKVWGTDSGSSSYGRNDGSSSTSDSRVSYSPTRGNENWWGKNSKQQDFKSNYKDNTERKSDGSQNKIGHWQSNETDRSTKRNKSRDRKSADGDISYNKNYTRITGDKEFDEFWKFLKTRTGKSFVKVDEIQEDLFKMPEEYALAHCVAEDMNMGSGIAVQFSQQFKRRDELYQQRQKQGGLAVLEVDNERYIYYLVTKKYSNGKPNTYTMWSSLMKLQQHIEEHQVKKLAMPRIGCGLDRLEWSEVKPMIEYIFRNTDIKITVCNFQQNYGKTKPKLKQKADPPKNPKQTRMNQYVTKQKNKKGKKK